MSILGNWGLDRQSNLSMLDIIHMHPLHCELCILASYYNATSQCLHMSHHYTASWVGPVLDIRVRCCDAAARSSLPDLSQSSRRECGMLWID